MDFQFFLVTFGPWWGQIFRKRVGRYKNGRGVIGKSILGLCILMRNLDFSNFVIDSPILGLLPLEMQVSVARALTLVLRKQNLVCGAQPARLEQGELPPSLLCQLQSAGEPTPRNRRM